MDDDVRLIRAALFHTPRNPFLGGETGSDALVAVGDGAVAVSGGVIVASGEYAALRRRYASAEVEDHRPGYLLPGCVDLHTHFPQAWGIGAMAGPLLDWLQQRTLPDEARLADVEHARRLARSFLAGLARNGTTTALVFGSHFAAAQDVLFEESAASGLRIASGLVLSDRNLVDALHQRPDDAYRASAELATRWHRHGRLRYAVSPRFALSTSEAMLEVAGALLRERSDVLLQTHLNESVGEVRAVGERFPWARDYLHVYDAFGLVGPRSVFAHDVHPTEGEMSRLGERGAAVAHCPSSNLFLGSGLFPLRAHVERRVKIGLGSDVGAGTGYGLLREGLAAYQVQALRADDRALGPAHLLYLATLGGAEAIGCADEVGALTPGRRADLQVIVPRPGGTLASVLEHADSAERALGALFTLAGEADVRRVYVDGEPLAYPAST